MRTSWKVMISAASCPPSASSSERFRTRRSREIFLDTKQNEIEFLDLMNFHSTKK